VSGQVVGLGEILWDRLPSGAVPGGAPFNFAIHAAGMGHPAAMVSAVGDDADGRLIVGMAAGRGVDVSGVATDPVRPTGAVDVVVDDAGKADYRFLANVAWDALRPTAAQRVVMSGAKAVCFGTLAQRSAESRAGLAALLDLASEALVVCDLNFRQGFHSAEVAEASLARSRWAKLNDEELPVLAGYLGLRSPGPADRARELLERFGLELVALTLGADGAILVTPGQTLRIAAPKVRVVDTVGSGDAFTAGLVARRLEGATLAEMLSFAIALAAVTATRKGGTPVVDRGEVEALAARL
jgi:fructokinase